MRALRALGAVTGLLTGYFNIPLAGAQQTPAAGGVYIGRQRLAIHQGIDNQALGPHLRYQKEYWPSMENLHWSQTATGTDGSVRTTNREDVIMAATGNSTAYIWTSTIGNIRYPARIGFTGFEDSSDGNQQMGCSYFDVYGYDIKGDMWAERVNGSSCVGPGTAPVGESCVATTSIAYARITRIATAAGGCTAGGAGDEWVVFLTQWVGLRAPAESSSPSVTTDDDLTSVTAVCKYDQNDASADTVCIAGTSFRVIGGKYNVVNLFTNEGSVGCTTFGGSTCTGIYAIGDSFSITYRASPR